MKWSRRQVVLSLLALGGGTFLPRWRRAHAGRSSGPLFEADHQRAISAAMDRVLPGAVEAGVPRHLEYWLREPVFQGAQREFKMAAVHLDRLARQENARAFADCSAEQQDGILLRFQEGKVRAKGFDGAAFFPRLVGFTLEGFLGDPRYGGNRDRAGWKFIGHGECWWGPKRLRRMLDSGAGLKD